MLYILFMLYICYILTPRQRCAGVCQGRPLAHILQVLKVNTNITEPVILKVNTNITAAKGWTTQSMIPLFPLAPHHSPL